MTLVYARKHIPLESDSKQGYRDGENESFSQKSDTDRSRTDKDQRESRTQHACLFFLFFFFYLYFIAYMGASPCARKAYKIIMSLHVRKDNQRFFAFFVIRIIDNFCNILKFVCCRLKWKPQLYSVSECKVIAEIPFLRYFSFLI